MNSLRAALISLAPFYGDIPRNLSLVEGYMRRLRALGVDLVCFPEMSLTGYGHSPEIVGLAQPANGFAVRQLQGIADAYGVAVFAGLPITTLPRERPCISQVFCAPDSAPTIYHKAHLRRSERQAFSAGNEMGLASWRSLVFGLQLCLDSHFPELSLAQASQGAGILLMSFASPMDTPETLRARWLRFLPARAYDSGCFVLVCNQAGESPDGKQFAGIALAFDPDGETIAEWCSDSPGEIVVDLDLSLVETARKRRRFLQQRRPALYQFASPQQEQA
ncbi:MAG: nitrilase-related carbon-nitrogen hydrolase [Chloroflexota bacterium]